MAEKLNKNPVYSAAKPKEKNYTINDGGGLVMSVKSPIMFLYKNFDEEEGHYGPTARGTAHPRRA